jgi:hypothetical protein
MRLIISLDYCLVRLKLLCIFGQILVKISSECGGIKTENKAF